ncbi:hypothetical protein CC1G_11097 [Coprinopsis cinerea okayama7|uniref:Nodulin-like domain-containing protein n=1 Tax=Coprinopsis cinerea (strain Okayama-7 / 130 / ATCC MYA-4618 / FGSC 9003) TaxID=240176 RepID=A8P7N5_COPC7|nr:hypothetical protein CC1G_11097 [Coprinopsis cinerea okayama7\|eukprot:XP_001839397.2 hypothetical protein CC1G_11097 [Coprinopsis cinerea okayama7\
MTQVHHPPIPPIYSVQRFVTLVSSIVVALASGTNYVSPLLAFGNVLFLIGFEAYGPQLANRLGISHTELNVVALAGNIGVYSTGPIWGRIVDKRGPRILLASACAFLLAGYLGIKFMYDAEEEGGEEDTKDGIPTLGFVFLALCCFLTGAGGCAGLAGAVNSTAKTFPDQMRATTTGLVISGFGLSAFLFSTVSQTVYAGNTSSFLSLLAFGTSVPLFLGLFTVRPIPLPSHDPLLDHEDGEDDEEDGGSGYHSATDGPGSRAPLLNHDENDEDHVFHQRNHSYSGAEGTSALPSPKQRADEGDVEMSPQRLGGGDSDVHVDSVGGRRGNRSLSRGAAMTLDLSPNVHGYKLWKSLDFYLLFWSLSLLSGTGLMYINNVGSMSQALYAFKNPSYDRVEAAKWQAMQVSAISVMNCLGRIFIASRIDHIADLWVASSVLGLGYGAVFSLFPTVCLEWFGMPHFSENWGFLSMSPMFAGNFFSLVFGYTLDKNEDFEDAPASDDGLLSPRSIGVSMVRRALAAVPALLHRAAQSPDSLPPPPLLSSTNATTPATANPHPNPIHIRCSKGLECYIESLYLTMGATLLAIGLTVWASWRDRRKIGRAMAGRTRGGRG